MQKYEKALTAVLQKQPTLGDSNRKLLKRLQQILKLRDEDIAAIHNRLIPQQSISASNTISLQPISTIDTKQPTTKEDYDLSSEKGVDYTRLRDLLAAGNWKDADYETYLVMLQAIGLKENDWISNEELLSFPCTDLRTIDRLWVKYSNGHFGFSVQKEIYLSVGGKPDGEYDAEAWKKFGDRVGWRVESNWISYTKFTFDTSVPKGHLPSDGIVQRSEFRVWYLFSRIETCKV